MVRVVLVYGTGQLVLDYWPTCPRAELSGYHIKCSTYVQRVSGITFIRNAQDRKIGKLNNFLVFGSNKAKGHKQE